MSRYTEAELAELDPETREHLLQQEADESARKLTYEIAQFFNQGGDAGAFARALCQQHRTIQQKIMGGFLTWCNVMPEYGVDARNEATVEFAREINPLVSQRFHVDKRERVVLPYI